MTCSPCVRVVPVYSEYGFGPLLICVDRMFYIYFLCIFYILLIVATYYCQKANNYEVNFISGDIDKNTYSSGLLTHLFASTYPKLNVIN